MLTVRFMLVLFHFLTQTMTMNLVNWSMGEDQLETARKDL